MFVNDSTGVLRRVLLSPPDYLEAAPINKIAEKWKNTGLDHKKMAAEFQLVLDAYKANGVQVEILGSKVNRPNSVFARDFGCCIKEGYILGNFKRSIRFDEHRDYKEEMEELGIPMVCEVENGIFEGGDFFMLDGTTVLIGMLDRSDETGIKEIRKALEPLGYTVLGMPGNPDFLHLDMCFNLITPNVAVGCPEALTDFILTELKKRNIELIPVPKEAIFLHGCNLQSLGNNRVLSLSLNRDVNLELEKRGITVIDLPITEILKAGGGPHCMTFPLKRD